MEAARTKKHTPGGDFCELGDHAKFSLPKMLAHMFGLEGQKLCKHCLIKVLAISWNSKPQSTFCFKKNNNLHEWGGTPMQNYRTLGEKFVVVVGWVVVCKPVLVFSFDFG